MTETTYSCWFSVNPGVSEESRFPQETNNANIATTTKQTIDTFMWFFKLHLSVNYLTSHKTRLVFEFVKTLRIIFETNMNQDSKATQIKPTDKMLFNPKLSVA